MSRTLPSRSTCVLGLLLFIGAGACRRGDDAVGARIRKLVSAPAPPASVKGARWKLVKQAKPQADGNILYMHVINPVVPGADYTVMQTLYEEYPEERQALYDLYRGAFAGSGMPVTATMVLDGSKAK